jgi:hypothetical protein
MHAVSLAGSIITAVWRDIAALEVLFSRLSGPDSRLVWGMTVEVSFSARE